MNKIDIIRKHIGNDDFYDINGTSLLIKILAAMDEYAHFVTKELKSELKECKKILNDPDLLSEYIGGI